MTREDAIYWIKNLAVLSTEKQMPQIEEALNMAVESLNQPKQADDLISRADAIEALNEIGSVDTYADRGYVKEILIQIPSAQPKIVRCKECKWADKCSQNIAMANTYQMYEKIDFCSYGKRREK